MVSLIFVGPRPSLYFLKIAVFTGLASVDTSFKQALKAKAHHLKPVVLLGAKGLTEAVIEETNIALTTHELIKVKINGAEKEDRQKIAAELCSQLQADLVQLIGNTAVIYRENEETTT